MIDVLKEGRSSVRKVSDHAAVKATVESVLAAIE